MLKKFIQHDSSWKSYFGVSAYCVLLNRIRLQLLDHQRPEQSGFTPKRSTVDRILAERLREYDEAVLAAYIDFKKAFDSVSRDVLWRLLELRGIPPHLVRLISALYTGTESAVRKCGAATSDFFPVKTGVRQGCVLAPSLFSTCMEWIMNRAVGGSGCGVSFGKVRRSGLCRRRSDLCGDSKLMS